MAYITDYILDAALSILDTEADRLYITSQEAITYTEATSTYALGVKNPIEVNAPQDRTPTGRSVTTVAFSDGTVTGTGTATHYAIVDSVNSRLLVTGPLTASQAVTAGNVFSLTAIEIGIADPTAV